MRKIKVMIVDDSAVVRKVLAETLNSVSDLEVIDTAIDPIFAMKKIAVQRPDVLILDIEMPQMDGLTFLKLLMKEENPIPVVICSSLTVKGSRVAIQALSFGAVDVVAKPTAGLKGFLEESTKLLADALRAAAKANLKNTRTTPIVSNGPGAKKNNPDVMLPAGRVLANQVDSRIVLIGASTGGTQALELIVSKLPKDAPGIVVVQHMPEEFTHAFSSRLNDIAQVEVIEASDGDQIRHGRVLIAPGGKHLLLEARGPGCVVRVKDGPLVSRHRPSVDVLFRSAARVLGKNALGIILTGMGDDGAIGLKEMRDNGAATLGQDKQSCVIYGMPAVAFAKGAVEREVPLENVVLEVTQWYAKTSKKTPEMT